MSYTREQDALPRLAILGSCVTRDAFGFDPETKGFMVVETIMRQSVVSMTSAPIVVAQPNYRDLTRFEQRCLEINLRKNGFQRLADAAPAWLVIDLIDERLDILRAHHGGLAAAAVGFLRHSDVMLDRDAAFVPVPRRWPGVEAALMARLPGWVERLKAIVPAERLVIHRAFWASHALGPDGPVEIAEGGRRAADVNPMLARTYDAISALSPSSPVIEVPAALRIADPDHRWGAGPYHLIGAYYDDFLARLRRIVTTPREASLSPCPDDHMSAATTPTVACLQEEAANAALEAEALFDLGRDATDPGSDSVLFERAVLAALLGSARGAGLVGMCLTQGRGIARDMQRGLRWLRHAVAAGDARSEEALARLRLEGRHLPPDAGLARIELRRAAQAGSATAAMRLAELYISGVGGEVDLQRAAYWMRQARHAHNAVLRSALKAGSRPVVADVSAGSGSPARARSAA